MKLKDIETFVTVPPTGVGGSFWVFVKLVTDNGIEGIGEVYAATFGRGMYKLNIAPVVSTPPSSTGRPGPWRTGSRRDRSIVSI